LNNLAGSPLTSASFGTIAMHATSTTAFLLSFLIGV